MKTNRDKNMQHERDQILKVRPKQPAFNFKPLEDVVNGWIRNSLKEHE